MIFVVLKIYLQGYKWEDIDLGSFFSIKKALENNSILSLILELYICCVFTEAFSRN